MAAETRAGEADRPRQQMIKEELERSHEWVLTFSAKDLAPRERLFLQKLLQGARLVDEIQLLQGSRKALDYRAEVQQSGTADDRKLFMRNAGPWCRHSDDVRCSALRSQPRRQRGGGTWPDDLTETERHRLASDAILGNPLVVVQRKGPRLEALPLARDPLLGPRVRGLSRSLREAASLVGEPTLGAYLRGQARAFESGRAEALWQSQLDWIRVRGPFEVLIGPYQPPGGVDLAKSHFGMLIGREDGTAAAELERYLKQLPALETDLVRLVGVELYKPRPVPAATLQAVEVIHASGSARLASGIVTSLERVVASQVAGSTKPEGRRLLFTNHLKVQASLLLSQARAVLAEGTVRAGGEQTAVLQAIWRDVCRRLGPRPDHQVATRDGRSTLQQQLGGLWPLFEQLQSELLALWALGQSRARIDIGDRQLLDRQTLSVARLIALLEHGPELVSAQAAGVLLGLLLDAKAVVVDETTGRWMLQSKRLPGALRELNKRVLTIELRGAKAAAAKLIAPYLVRTVENVVFADKLERLRSQAKQAFAAAGVKPASLVYAVTDLETKEYGKE